MLQYIKRGKKTCILYASENFTEVCIYDFSTQDIPKPLFMSTKEPTDWSEDEQKLAKEYEKKVKDLQEEREKYRKVSITQCLMVAGYAGKLGPLAVF